MSSKNRKFAGKNRSHIALKKSTVALLATGGMLNFTAFAAIDVPGASGGSDLSTYLNDPGVTDYTFEILSDVTLNSSFLMNTAARSNVTINGNGHTITRGHGDQKFWINYNNVNFTLRNAILSAADASGTQGIISVYLGVEDLTLDLDGTTIKNNVGNGYGFAGGLANHGSNTVVKGNVTFEDNHAIGSAAGAVVAFNHAGLNFKDNVRFSGNSAADIGGALTSGAGAAVTFESNVDFEENHAGNRGGAMFLLDVSSVTFNKEVTFTENYAQNLAGGAAYLLNTSSLTFNDKATFTENYSQLSLGGALYLEAASTATFNDEAIFTGNYTQGNSGGAIYLQTASSVLFEKTATFTGNHSRSESGGAIAIADGRSTAYFKEDAIFTDNYVKNAVGVATGARGGAVVIGNYAGNTSPQFVVDGQATFEGNYVWAEGNAYAQGGAIALSDRVNLPSAPGLFTDRVYGVSIDRGIFTNNFAYSVSGEGNGGAIYSSSYNSLLTFGSGTEFTGNVAKTKGGAIYFNQGVINLSGNVRFRDNLHGATFSTDDGILTPNRSQGTANAIYFTAGNSPATLNLSTAAGEVISFDDPIESAAGRIVTVNKTGDGTVVFSRYDSNILANTIVSAGTFELEQGVSYGRLESSNPTSFKLIDGATLKGGRDATLIAHEVQLMGIVNVADGEFNINSNSMEILSTAILQFTITNRDVYSSINMQGNELSIDGAKLEIDAKNYVPSQNYSDSFEIISNLAGEPVWSFQNGNMIIINGAEFEIQYRNNSIVLQQITVPEPSTYALLLAIGCVGFAWSRRKNKNGKQALV